MDAYRISPEEVRLYVSGAHRRPTDPATPQEIDAALGLLYGPTGKVHSLEEADALAANPQGWKAVNDVLEPQFRIFPEMIRQVSPSLRVPPKAPQDE